MRTWEWVNVIWDDINMIVSGRVNDWIMWLLLRLSNGGLGNYV